MTTDILALPGSSLNAFLFADVGTEANGMTLSVLSVLARSNLDPWQEAARLAKLPQPKSIEAMTALIRNMPGNHWSPPETVLIAMRLATLLPSAKAAATTRLSSPPKPASRRIVLGSRQWMAVVIVLSAVFAGLAAGAALGSPDGTAVQDTAPPAWPLR